MEKKIFNCEYSLDQALLDEKKKIMVIFFGLIQKRSLKLYNLKIAFTLKKFSKFFALYVFDNKKMTNFNRMYELFKKKCLVFFFKNKIIQIDLGSGNNNKIEKFYFNKNDSIHFLETIYWNLIKGKTIKL
jgi:DIM1 family U5 snRNP protein